MKKMFRLITVMLIAVVVFACSSEPDGFTLTVNNVGQGEVTRNPQNDFYEENAKVTASAVPSDGWKFKEWSGDASGTTDSVEITMDKDKSITATFVEKEKYTFTASVSPTGAGTITFNPPTGPYCEGSDVTVTAVSNEGYAFDHWDSGMSGNENPTTVRITESIFVVAEFVETYTLTTDVSPANVGTVTLDPPTGPYKNGSSVTVTAVKNGEGHAFDHWEGSLSGDRNPEVITIDENKTVRAIFKEGYVLTAKTKGPGYIWADPEMKMYPKNSTVTVTACNIVNASDFTGWEGDLSGTEIKHTITLTGDKSVTAVFETGDRVSFYEDFEQNDDSWSTLYDDYTLYSANANSPGVDINKYPFVQKHIVRKGNWAAQFADVGGFEYSSFKIDVDLENESTLSFYYKVDSEKYFDNLYFAVDSTNMRDDHDLQHSGNVNWTKYESILEAGTHTLEWQYRKDMKNDKGEDTAWIDDIIIREPLPKHKLTVISTGYGWVNKWIREKESYVDDYEEGVTIRLEAKAGPDQSFTKWSGTNAPADHLTDPTIEVVMGTSDMDIEAEFTGEFPPTEWLIMAYIGGDGNLQNSLWADLNEIELGLYKLDETVRNHIKIVALWDGIHDEDTSPPADTIPPEDTKLYELGPDPDHNLKLSPATKDLTESKWWTGNEVDMSDGATVTAFLNWAKTRYPNHTNTMFMLSDHGGGARNRNGKSRGRGAIWDETSGGFNFFLETKELSKAISDAEFKDDHKLSILGFDACLMASVEEAYEHRTVADYYVASLETEQFDGWEYDHWIPQITVGMSPVELGTLLVKSYHDNFSGKPKTSNQTLSCTDLSKMDALKTAIDALGKAIKDNNLVEECKTVFQKSTKFKGTWAPLYEVGSFASRLSSATVSTEAIAVVNAMKEAIVYSWAGSDSGDYYGAGSETGRGLHLVGEVEYDEYYFDYDTSIFSFADSDWATLHNEWYPRPQS